MRSFASTCMTPKPVASATGTSRQRDGDVGAGVDVLDQHPLVVHLVDVIAGEDDDVFGRVAVDDVDVLEHRVGGARVPLVLGDALARRQDVEALVAHRLQEVPAALQVPDQAVRLVLRRDRDAPDARVERVRQREIDDARLAAEIDGGLRAPFGELHQPAAAAAGEHVGHRRARERRRVGYLVHARPRRCRVAVRTRRRRSCAALVHEPKGAERRQRDRRPSREGHGMRPASASTPPALPQFDPP